ncbi:20014_t:CDS:1, partial [Racocetra fulgida]
RRWFNDQVIQKNQQIDEERAISIRNGQEFGVFEHEIGVNFSFIDSMRGQCVFTPKVRHHLKKRALYGKGFSLMKKTLNWAIETGHAKELYKLHQEFIEEMEKQLEMQHGCAAQSNQKNVFYETINNPPQLRTKGRKNHKRIASFTSISGAQKRVFNGTVASGAQKRVFNETVASMQHNKETSNISVCNESIVTNNANGQKMTTANNDYKQVHDVQVQILQYQEQGQNK